MLATLACAMLVCNTLFAQSENVPASHPVYTFLKRLEVKQVIERYHDAVIPLSRREVASFLDAADKRRGALSRAEQSWLDDYLTEFQFDRTGRTEGFATLIPSDGLPEGGGPSGLSALFADRERFLYSYADSNVTLFTNALLDLDARWISGDALGRASSQYLQIGGRARGSAWQKFGYFIQWTNAQFWGSRALLARDPRISQSHALATENAQNFDFVEGYVRYDARIASAQLGRERVLWGTGYNEKFTLSDNVRVFDFVRADASYKSLKYTFLHGWLMGRPSHIMFTLPTDSATFIEPVAADKYFAAHRLELSFPRVLDFGLQEMVVYSNRSPDLAYLNPLTVFESAQRSRGERDNVFWAFDLQLHLIPNLELSATLLFDDIHVPDLFSNKWSDRYAWQAGLFYADPFTLPNTSLIVEYSRVEPYVFTHGRSRDNSYTSLDVLLGPEIGPNADSWFARADWLPLRNLSFSLDVTLERKGLNVVDAAGTLLKNVGGDVFQPHRDSDPEQKKFLDGTLVKTRSFRLQATWEVINQLWVDAAFRYRSSERVTAGQRDQNGQAALHVRMEF